MAEDSTQYQLLPHHEQRSLCTTRLPYRQGRKLTAVKVYSINNESKHLLVFGVPSLNLRQETKALFSKFGKLQQFNITKYPSEQFTETYHAIYEDIQSARVAKKMLDNKNYYGGILHICYAPELESVQETKEKLLLRQKNVVARLKNLQKTSEPNNNLHKHSETVEESETNKNVNTNKLFMGNINNIQIGKRKYEESKKKIKKLKHAKSMSTTECLPSTSVANNDNYVVSGKPDTAVSISNNIEESSTIEVIDFTSTDTEILTNINESLNYSNFGKELIRKIPLKPVNKIKFCINKNA